MTTAFVSIGSNIERDRHIRAGVSALKNDFGPLTLSSVYESAAVGFRGAPFFNLVAAFSTDRRVSEVVEVLHRIEKNNGRAHERKKFCDRNLDLDLILFGDQLSDTDELKLPRDEVTRYAFILEPLAEIAGQLKHPVLQTSYAELWRAFDKEGIRQKRIVFDL